MWNRGQARPRQAGRILCLREKNTGREGVSRRGRVEKEREEIGVELAVSRSLGNSEDTGQLELASWESVLG